MNKYPLMRIISFLLAMLISMSCSKYAAPNHQDPLPACVNDAIDKIKTNNYKADVWKYDLEGKIVFEISYNQCCDFINTIYDSGCNVVCESGGITGRRCPDSILENLKNKTKVFSN